MVGLFGTGKTCLVQRFVHSVFSNALPQHGGRQDRSDMLDVDGTSVTLSLWDLAGRDREQDVAASYLRGAHGIIYVIDGTRRETFDQIFELHELVGTLLARSPRWSP